MPHSGAALRLRAEVVESELLLSAGMSYLQAMSALYSHPDADVEKGQGQMNTLYFDALAHVPYLTQGKSGKDSVEEAREAAIQRYRDMKNRMERKPQDT